MNTDPNASLPVSEKPETPTDPPSAAPVKELPSATVKQRLVYKGKHYEEGETLTAPLATLKAFGVCVKITR